MAKPGIFSLEWLAQHLTELIPEYPAAALCVAFSGGADSTALLAALAELRKTQRSALKLRALHIHHGLHPNAAGWSKHCKALAKQLHVPLTIRKVKVERTPGSSVEAAARSARYEAFTEVLAPGEYLLTAHHQDDQLETVLLQLFRGAGLAGLAAMPARTRFAQGWLVRPLLPLTRAQLEAWTRSRELTWVDDDTNVDERFDRNYLRRQVLPLIQARWPGAATAVCRSARHAAEAQRLLDVLALHDAERAAHGDALSVKYLRTLDVARRRNALRYWITRAGARVPNTARLEELAGPMLDARPEASPKLSYGNTTIQRRADLLWINLC